jgi:EmrB/QacA subfamily drug resistance transporter
MQSLPKTMPRWTLALTSVAFFMVALDNLVVTTALPAIRADTGASLTTLEWTVNAYTLTCAAGIITAAALGDRYGRRRVFAAGLALFTAASAACALAPTAGLLIGARAVQGLGAAIIMPLSLTLLTGAFPAHRRGAVVGIWGGVAGLAVASGPLVGGAVTESLDWHWIFWLNVPIGVAGTALSVRRLAESRGPATRLDLPGVGLASAGAVAVLWGLVRAGEAGWGSLEVVASLAGGVALIAGFVEWERRVEQPMLPVRLFRSLSFTAANTTAFMMVAALYAAAFLVAQYFQTGLGYSPLGAGLRLLPWTAAPLVVAPLAGALSDRIGPRRLMFAGMLLQGAGLAWFALAVSADVAYAELIGPFLVAGVGISLALPSTPAAVLGAVAPPDMGKASGTTNTLQRFGGAFGIAATTAVFAANGQMGTPAGFAEGLRPALGVAAAFSVLGALSALGVRTARHRTGAPAPDARPGAAADRGPGHGDDRQPEATATVRAGR